MRDSREKKITYILIKCSKLNVLQKSLIFWLNVSKYVYRMFLTSPKSPKKLNNPFAQKGKNHENPHLNPTTGSRVWRGQRYLCLSLRAHFFLNRDSTHSKTCYKNSLNICLIYPLSADYIPYLNPSSGPLVVRKNHFRDLLPMHSSLCKEYTLLSKKKLITRRLSVENHYMLSVPAADFQRTEQNCMFVMLEHSWRLRKIPTSSYGLILVQKAHVGQLNNFHRTLW